MVQRAEIIAVGTELLLGSVANTDAQMLSRALSALGINVYWHTVVGDNPERLRQALELAKSRADLIITTGGLGPTCDDLTKEIVAACFGKKLTLRKELAEEIRAIYVDKIYAPMPENNLRQAMMPEGCTVLRNRAGTAPGCAFCEGDTHVIMLPGPPHECRTVWEDGALPYLQALSAEVILSRELRVFGMGESRMEELLHEQMLQLQNPSLAPYATFGECFVRITAKAKSETEAKRMIAPVEDEVRAILGDVIYGVEGDSLESVVSHLLRERKLTLASAESCTGGLLCKRMTDLSGASSVFRGGVVSYVNEVKAGVLGVSRETLDRFGAVSAETAKEMAEGVRRICGSDIGVSFTGVAGPDKDDRGNEVGTVYIAVATEQESYVKLLHLGGGRDRIRVLAASHGLDLIRRTLLQLPR